MLAKRIPNSLFVSRALAGRKRPRFKKVGMKRARKKKLDAPEPPLEVESTMADGGNDERLADAAAAALPALVAPPAPHDELQQELEAAREEAFVAAEAAELLAKKQRMASVAFDVVQKKFDAALNRLDKRMLVKDKMKRPDPFERVRISFEESAKLYQGHVAMLKAELACAYAAVSAEEAKVAARDVQVRVLQRSIRRLKAAHNRRSRVRADVGARK